MGSYLTIVNDTNIPWKCKVGADTKALEWGLVIGTVGAAVMSAATVGGVAIALGATAAEAIAAGAATWIFTAGFGALTSNAINDGVNHVLQVKGYDVIQPSERKRYGKMSLSLWRQCECINAAAAGNGSSVESVMMRPIFSGATDKSNREYSIGQWIKKHGTKRTVIAEKAKGHGRL